jgi:YHS domain-containing protein
MFALLLASALAADPTPDAKEVFKPLTALVGGWKCTGKMDDAEKTFWTERAEWSWKYKDGAAWLAVTFEKGKHFTSGELRYDAKAKQFTLALATVGKATEEYTGTLAVDDKKGTTLQLERTDGDTLTQFTLTILHGNRHLYSVGTRPKGVETVTRLYQVGATKEGEPFAEEAKGPECVVSGGRGTITVSYKGKDYFVCCSGCRDEFKGDPEKYIKLAEKRK